MAPTDEMMPELPEPLEALLVAYGKAQEEMGVVHDRPSQFTDANHATFEAERALRLAILAYPHDAAAGAIARLTEEGTPPHE